MIVCWGSMVERCFLTDHGQDRAKAEIHDLQNVIDHTKMKAHHQQTNVIGDCLHKTILQEFYQPVLSRKIFGSVEQLQADLDEWLEYENNEHTDQGKRCCLRLPMETLHNGERTWKEQFAS